METGFQRKGKIKAAKKIGTRRRELKWHKEHRDELERNLNRQRNRMKRGLPIEAPLMKPWDHAKGKLPNTNLTDVAAGTINQ